MVRFKFASCLSLWLHMNAIYIASISVADEIGFTQPGKMMFIKLFWRCSWIFQCCR